MMHFARLQASGPGACLDDLLASRFLPKRWIARIWSASDLPVRLQPCVRNLKPGAEWRAYGGEGQIFFAIARMHAAESPDGCEKAIDAYFLDSNAVVYAAGVWEYNRTKGWWLDAVMELSYDCERGWWLDAVMGPESAPYPGAAPFPPEGAEVRLLNGGVQRLTDYNVERAAPRRRKLRS
jgi:hypothetical protein